jgi:hypothetical protein
LLAIRVALFPPNGRMESIHQAVYLQSRCIIDFLFKSQLDPSTSHTRPCHGSKVTRTVQIPPTECWSPASKIWVSKP